MRYRVILMLMLLPLSQASASQFQMAERVLGEGDLISGMRLLRAAAEAGDARAQARLGEILDKAEEDSEAVAWFRKSAEQGDVAGLFGLGMAHLTGEGVPRDSATALSLIRRAAEQGYQNAVEVMATAYRVGGLGLMPDVVQATYWSGRASAIRDADLRQRIAVSQDPGSTGKGSAR